MTAKSLRAICISLCVLAPLSGFALGTESADLQTIEVAHETEVPLKHAIVWVADEAARNPEEIRGDFVAYNGEGFDSQNIWAQFRVSGTDGVHAARYLQLDMLGATELEVWVRAEDKRWRLAMQHGVDGRIGFTASSRPGVWLPVSEESIDVVLRMHEKTGFTPELRLMNEARFIQFSRNVVVAEVLGFGLLLALALYACISLYVVRDRVYFWMGFYCLSSLVFVAHQAGYGLYLFGAGYLPINGVLTFSSPFFVFATFMALARDLMSWRSHLLANIYIWSNFLVGAIITFVFVPGLFTVAMLASGAISILVTPIALFQACRGDRKALQFFVANLGSLIGGTFVLWSQLSGLHAADFTHASMMYGIATTGLLVVLMLALRYKQMLEEQSQLREQELLARQAANESEAIANAKSSFLATMSHEIRTPMNGVLGLASLLSETKLESNQKEYLHAIERSGKSLIAILDDILDYTKFEQGHLQLEREQVDLVELIDDVMLGVQHRSAGKALDLRTEFMHSAPEYVVGDPTRMRQVLANLVGNAIKFTDQGHVTLRIFYAEPMTHFVISDSGIGIPPEELPKLFERFQQADTSITRKYGGTGLGLAISRLLVRAMGGDIEVSSQVGQGSEFKVTMQLDTDAEISTRKLDKITFTGAADAVTTASEFVARWDVDAEAVQAESAAPVGETLQCSWPLKLTRLRAVVCGVDRDAIDSDSFDTPLEGLNVLVAEDNQINQIVIERHLEKLGASVKLVENGQLAFDAVTDEHYDVVLMDCEMPVVDGYSATRMLREDSQEALPIIALTAHAGKEHRDKAIAAGMNGYLTKPINRAELVNMILNHAVCRTDKPAVRSSS